MHSLWAENKSVVLRKRKTRKRFEIQEQPMHRRHLLTINKRVPAGIDKFPSNYKEHSPCSPEDSYAKITAITQSRKTYVPLTILAISLSGPQFWSTQNGVTLP